MAIQKHNRSSERTTGRLVRGIDPIPENWELASGYRALQSLARSRTTLKRLLAEPAAAAPSDFRSVLTAVERARAYIRADFPSKRLSRWHACGESYSGRQLAE
jgi:hypothetical protein